jgi:hypothetical protein
MRRFSALVVLAAFALSCGGQWGLLQGLAWANMIREYAQVVPLAQAVQMTFSGHYPCAMCKLIAEKKTKQDQAGLLAKQDKKQAPIIAALATVDRPASPLVFPVRETSLVTRADVPPTPPPRGLLS